MEICSSSKRDPTRNVSAHRRFIQLASCRKERERVREPEPVEKSLSWSFGERLAVCCLAAAIFSLQRFWILEPTWGFAVSGAASDGLAHSSSSSSIG